jgi:outer membrane protein assembly factor BamB
VAVSVDSSPAIGDFFVDDDNDPATPNVWKTILVGTAVVFSPGQGRESANQGAVFAMDVTDPYSPKLLWERTYKDKINLAALKIERNYYPKGADQNGGHFPATYINAENALLDVNMGNSRGAAVGRVRVGAKLSTYVFLTSRWINQVDTGTAGNPHHVWGLSAHALDFMTGDIVWSTKVLYTGDAEGVNETPAIPSLMDIDDTGTQDYVVFGDMQGRLWILRTSDGRSLTGDSPAYVVKDSGEKPMGVREPIGASVSVYRNYIVFGTGARDSLTDESTTQYHVYALQVTPSGVVSLWKDNVRGKDAPITLNTGEKIWCAPLMDPAGNIYIATGQGYSDVGRPDLVRNNSKGRFILASRASGAIQGSPVTFAGAVVGGMDIENRHAYLITYDGSVVQIGGNDFASSNAQGNPIKILWWKKL